VAKKDEKIKQLRAAIRDYAMGGGSSSEDQITNPNPIVPKININDIKVRVNNSILQSSISQL